jgi:hypothetical protein
MHAPEKLQRLTLARLRAGDASQVREALDELQQIEAPDSFQSVIRHELSELVAVALTHTDLQYQCADLLARAGEPALKQVLLVVESRESSEAVAALDLLARVMEESEHTSTAEPISEATHDRVRQELQLFSHDARRKEVAEHASEILGADATPEQPEPGKLPQTA